MEILMPTTILHISDTKVHDVVDKAIKFDDAIKVTAEKEDDGTWRITVYFPSAIVGNNT